MNYQDFWNKAQELLESKGSPYTLTVAKDRAIVNKDKIEGEKPYFVIIHNAEEKYVERRQMKKDSFGRAEIITDTSKKLSYTNDAELFKVVDNIFDNIKTILEKECSVDRFIEERQNADESIERQKEEKNMFCKHSTDNGTIKLTKGQVICMPDSGKLATSNTDCCRALFGYKLGEKAPGKARFVPKMIKEKYGDGFVHCWFASFDGEIGPWYGKNKKRRFQNILEKEGDDIAGIDMRYLGMPEGLLQSYDIDKVDASLLVFDRVQVQNKVERIVFLGVFQDLGPNSNKMGEFKYKKFKKIADEISL